MHEAAGSVLVHKSTPLASSEQEKDEVVFLDSFYLGFGLFRWLNRYDPEMAVERPWALSKLHRVLEW